jgi:hypothetical protein
MEKVKAGAQDTTTTRISSFVSTPFHDEFLADMMQSHLVKDFCIIGPRVSYLYYVSFLVCSVRLEKTVRLLSIRQINLYLKQ